MKCWSLYSVNSSIFCFYIIEYVGILISLVTKSQSTSKNHPLQVGTDSYIALSI